MLTQAEHLATTRAGQHATRAVRADLRDGAHLIAWWPSATRDAAEVADRYEDLGLGLTDASLVVLTARVVTTDIATFDVQHFRAVMPIGNADAFRPPSPKRLRKSRARRSLP